MFKNLIKRLKEILSLTGKKNRLKFSGSLSAKLIKNDDEIIDYGVVSRKCITTAGVNYLADSFQSSTGSPIDIFVYHDSGTGTTTESASDTGLETPCGEARDEGTKEEGDSTNIYKSVISHVYSDTFAITEHGLFSAPSSGTLWDRSVFDAINVVDGYKIHWTYLLTIDAGG